MKQVYNKITGKYEMMPKSTVDALLTVDKVTVFEDNATKEVVVIKDCEINYKRYRINDVAILSVVEAHRWQSLGCCRINEVKQLDNKIEKITTSEKVKVKKEVVKKANKK